jgi:hypothetical protein
LSGTFATAPTISTRSQDSSPSPVGKTKSAGARPATAARLSARIQHKSWAYMVNVELVSRTAKTPPMLSTESQQGKT